MFSTHLSHMGHVSWVFSQFTYVFLYVCVMSQVCLFHCYVPCTSMYLRFIVLSSFKCCFWPHHEFKLRVFMASSRSQHATPLVNHLLCLLHGHRPEPLDILHRQDSLSQHFGCNGAGDYILDFIWNLTHAWQQIDKNWFQTIQIHHSESRWRNSTFQVVFGINVNLVTPGWELTLHEGLMEVGSGSRQS